MGYLFFAFTSLVFSSFHSFLRMHAICLFLLPFLIEDGCCWSDQLKTELLQKPELIQEISQEMIPWQVFLKGKEMRNKYRVQCPLILLLNPKGTISS